MTFKYTLGNPPFQDESDKSNGRKLYLDISARFIGMMPDDGELIFLTPSTLANDKKKRLSLKNTLHLKSLDYTADNDFDVGVEIIQFHIDKKYNDKIKVIENNKTTYREFGESLVKENKIIPIRLFEKIKSQGSNDKMFIGDVTSNGYRKTKEELDKLPLDAEVKIVIKKTGFKDVKITKLKKDFIYEIVVNDIKDKLEYTYIKPKLYQQKKIAIHMGQAYNADNYRLDNRSYGQYQNMIDVHNCSDEQIENIKSFLYSATVIELCKKFREVYNTGFNNIIYFFKKINYDKKYNEKSVQEFFNMTPEEIDWLFNSVKETPNKGVIAIEEQDYSEDRESRFKETGEIFTPLSRVDKMLNLLDIDWDNPPQNDKFIDPTCGSGNFLVQISIRGVPLKNIFGVDLMPDNIETTKRRLREIYGDTADTNYHLDRNIIKADALKYHYEFYEHVPPGFLF